MSKPADEFWDNLGWAAIWLGFFGGIALLVWAIGVAANRPTRDDQLQQQCTQQHGSWVLKQLGSGRSADKYYTCDFTGKK